MQNIFSSPGALIISVAAFGYGAAKLFRKKKPLYFQLLICATGCFMLQQLSVTVNIWCDTVTPVNIGMAGIFGCNFFLLSANYGTLDRIVDDGEGSQKARKKAVIAPLVTALLIVCVFLCNKNTDMFYAVISSVILLPAVPASYFNLKHILLPMDPFEFLKATRSCNITALLFYLVTVIYLIASAYAGDIVCGLLSVLMSVSAAGISVSAVKGAKKWEI